MSGRDTQRGDRRPPSRRAETASTALAIAFIIAVYPVIAGNGSCGASKQATETTSSGYTTTVLVQRRSGYTVQPGNAVSHSVDADFVGVTAEVRWTFPEGATNVTVDGADGPVTIEGNTATFDFNGFHTATISYTAPQLPTGTPSMEVVDTVSVTGGDATATVSIETRIAPYPSSGDKASPVGSAVRVLPVRPHAAGPKQNEALVWRTELWLYSPGDELTGPMCTTWLEFLQNRNVFFGVRFPVLPTLQGPAGSHTLPLVERGEHAPRLSLLDYRAQDMSVMTVPLELRAERIRHHWPVSSDGYTRSVLGNDRLTQLDGLRALAFLMVFLHNALAVPMLWAGVDLFFVLSGFLITAIGLRNRRRPAFLRTFLLRRFLRIVPPYYLVLGLAFGFLGLAWQGHWYWYVLFLSNFRESFTHDLSLHALRPMWSLAVEMHFYVTWIPLIVVVNRRTFARCCMALIVFAPVFRGVVTLLFESFRPAHHLTLARFDLFAAGALLAILWESDAEKVVRLVPHAIWTSCAAAAVFGVCAAAVPGFYTSANSLVFNILGYSLLNVMAFGVVAVCVGSCSGTVYRVLTWKPLVLLGTVSYMMYLCHQLFLDGFRLMNLAPSWTVPLAFAAALLLSTASWHLVEKPISGLKRRRYTYTT